MKEKIHTIDLFTGCGGLMDGFEATGFYDTLACVEWEKAPCENTKQRLKNKWGYADADNKVLQFDIQRTNELFNGWNDKKFGKHKGLDSLVKNKKVDLIIGGPPCQAYSVAGRIRDEKGMKEDYRNFLFESFIKVVKKYKPKAFVFENVPGLLSAKPKNSLIILDIVKAFDKAGYVVIDPKKALIDFTEYGIPQNRKRLIILGIRKDVFGEKAEGLLVKFYAELANQKEKKQTVKQAICDLPKLLPNQDGKIDCYTKSKVPNHIARYQSKRDKNIFNMLAKDIETGKNKFVKISELKKVYKKATGSDCAVHKYNVLRLDKPSNTIPAHLYKDGLRHIHPDSKQSRTITVREAARLQTFPDDYVFIGSMADQFKMIGNAVPPKFSEKLANVIYNVLFAK
jgi:DNA-cytosine methyltransferase